MASEVFRKGCHAWFCERVNLAKIAKKIKIYKKRKGKIYEKEKNFFGAARIGDDGIFICRLW